MFGIGMPEMLMILAVALIIFGPKRLPELAKSLGRALGEFRRATSDLKQSIETDTGLDEVRSSLNEVKKDVQSQMDLADAAPPASSTPASDQSPADDPLDKVKTAFDEMNADEDTPPSAAEVTSESPSTADTDPENRDQEKDTP
jgi:TatA/E family protein of Tat protein translocase